MSNDTNADSQQPNPGEGGAATDAANPTAAQGTDPAKAQGQGDGGNNAGGDAGKQGEAGAGATNDGKSGDGQGKTDEGADTGPPEAYADFTLPEGFVLDGERKEATLALFRDMGLSQDRAQKAIDHFIKTVGEDEATRTAALEAAVAQQREEWGNQAKAELGDKYDAEVAYAKTAVHATQNPKLVAAFDELGWGNHPELIKAFAFFGKMMRDSAVDGIGNAGGEAKPATPWARTYPDMNK